MARQDVGTVMGHRPGGVMAMVRSRDRPTVLGVVGLLTARPSGVRRKVARAVAVREAAALRVVHLMDLRVLASVDLASVDRVAVVLAAASVAECVAASAAAG